MNITKRRVAFVAALIVSVLAIVTVCGLAGCSSFSRNVKSAVSDYSGGLDRTVTLYDSKSDRVNRLPNQLFVGEITESMALTMIASHLGLEVNLDIDVAG